MVEPRIYTVGGTVQANERGLYIPRPADETLLQLCQQSEFAYVLTPRQLGKSSLMIRTAEQLLDDGGQAVIIDLTQIGIEVSAEQWYRGVLTLIADQLMLRVPIADWWEAHNHLGVTQRLTQFFQQVVMAEVADPVTIFVDEIDTTLSLDFTDDFFAAIRYLYVARATQPELRQLSFVLIGVATPGDLIRDPKRTPFNIGQRVDLTDFTPAEALPLVSGLGLPADQTENVLGWVLKWTGGHPYLTQRLCQAMAQVGGTSWSEADIDRLVATTFMGAQSEQDNNLQFVRDMLTKRAPEAVGAVAILKTYREIRRGQRPIADEEQSLVKSHLKLSGIVQRHGRNLQIRNLIYRQVFDWDWIKTHLPESLWQRLKPALPIIATLLIAFMGMSATTVYANQQRVRAEEALQQVESERQKTQEALNKAQEALTLAKKQTSTAQTAQKEAKEAASEATRQRNNADQQAKNAQKQAQLANEQRQRAEAQTQLAQQQTARANAEKERADAGAEAAQQEATRAEYQTTIANLRGQAARALYLVTTRPVEGMVLAIQAMGESRDKRVPEVLVTVNDSLLNAVQTVRERNLLSGHQGSARSVAVTPDGQTIVSGGSDGTVRLWNRDGQTIGQPFSGHQGSVTSVAVTPDGQTIVSGGDDGTVRLWNRDGQTIGQPSSGNQGIVWSVAVTPDGQTIVSGGSDGTVRLWNRDGQTIGQPFSENQGIVRSVAVTPDGQTIVSGGDDGTVRLWNRDGQPIGQPFSGNQASVTSVAVTPDGQTIVSGGSNGTVRLWNRDGQPIGQPFSGNQRIVRSVAVTPDGQTIVSGGNDGTVRLWQGPDGWLRAACTQLQGHSVLRDPDSSFDPVIARGARDTCERYVWGRE